MLRLERSSPYRREIAIRFRSRDPFLSRPLLIGLAVALLLHLLFFLCVEINPYRTPCEQIAPPTPVAVDLGSLIEIGGLLATSEMESYGLLPRHIIEPEPPRPKFPTLPPQAVERTPFIAAAPLVHTDAPFRQMRPAITLRRTPLVAVHRRYHPARVELSGPLATLPLIDDGTGIWGEERKNRGRSELYTLLFEVQLEEKTGSLFWVRQVNSTDRAPLDEKGRQIVERLRFAPKPFGTVEGGMVEVCFEVESQDPHGLLEWSDEDG